MTVAEDPAAYHRAYYVKRRQKLWDYLGGACVVCGVTENLQFDHIEKFQKSFDIKTNLTLNDKVKAELDKCQLLCKPHHEEKTAKENEGFTHGTLYGWMNKKCKCDPCTLKKWEWHDRRNARRRTGSARGPYKTRRQGPVAQSVEATGSSPAQ